MKKVVKFTIKSLLVAILSFCVLNIIKTYAGEPIFKITDITIKEKSAGVTVNDVDLNNDEITNDVTFTDVTDYITYDLKLKNTSEDDYIIKSISDNNSSVYLNYSYSNINNLVVKAGNETDVDLTITYFKQATDPNLSLGSTTITITYEKVVINPDTGEVTPSGDTNTDEITPSVNPKTNDGVAIYFVLGTMSLLALIILSKTNKKSKLLVITLLVLIPLCANAGSLKLTIKFNNTLKATAYDVEMDLGNGSSIIYNTLAKGAKLTRPNNPTKRGYTFDNWYLNNDVYDFNTPITGPISLEARYTKDTYTLSYDLDGGSLEEGKTNPPEYDIDSDITLFEPSKVGHVFSGWKLYGSTEIIKPVRIYDEVGNKSYTAIYTPENYVITFNPNNGEGTFTVNADYGTKVSEPTAPSKDGYTFSYWKLNDTQYSFNTLVTGPITLVAVYTPNGDTPYTVYHRYRHLNDSGFDTYEEHLTGETDKEVTLAFREQTGFDNPSQSKKLTIDGSGNSSEEYIYERSMYTLNVTDRSNLTNESTSNGDYAFETTITLVAGEKTGHTFTGWRLSGEEGYISNNSTYSFDISSNVTITPVYTPITYHITLDPDNGDSKIDQYVEYNSLVNIPTEIPTKDGYTFSNWYLGDNVYNFSTPVSSKFELKAHYTLNTYHLYYVLGEGASLDEGKTNPDTYTILDEFTLNNPSRPGYTFNGWSSSISSSITQVVTVSNQFGDVTYTANYTANTNTPYKVIHKYKNLSGSQEEYDIVERSYTGTTDTIVNAPVENKTGFVLDGEEGTIKILGTGDAYKEYIYNREEYTLNVTDRTNLDESSSANQNYEYGSEITLIAKNVEGYTFKGWKLSGSSTYISEEQTYTFNIEGNVSIAPIYEKSVYQVSLDPNNNNEPITYQSIEHGLLVTKPSDPTPANGYKFDYWTLNNVEYDFTTPVTQAIDLVAKYSLEEYEITYILDDGELQEGLSNPDTYTINSNITLYNPAKAGYDFTGWTINDGDVLYPTINIQNQTGNVTYTAHYELQQAAPIICRKAVTLNEATCQLTGSSNSCSAAGYAKGEVIKYGNIVNSDTYSVGDAFDCDVDGTGNYKRFYYLRTLDEKAVLISNSNFEGDNGQLNEHNFTYDVALTKLPRSADQWTNFPVTFGDYAARLVTLDDLKAAANTDDLTADKVFKDLPFLYENIGKYTTSSGRSTVWVHSDEEDYNNNHAYRYHVNGLHINIASIRETSSSTASSNCVRPVVEVPLELIDDSYVVHFDANGGTASSEYKLVSRGSKLGVLPDATNGQYLLDNWYTTDQFSEVVDENTIPSGYETYYAKWVLSVTNAIFERDSFNLQNGDTASIVINNADDIESYTFESNNELVATVTQEGLITTTGVGNTTIIVRGNKTQQTVNIPVNVTEATNYYVVTLDYQDERDNEELNITKGENISGLPNPTRTDYVFDGWYKDTYWNDKVENGDSLNSDVTLYARWMPNDTVVEMNKTYYSNIQTAINEAPANVKTTIRVVKNLDLDPSLAYSNQTLLNIPSKKNLVLDLDGHELTFNPTSKLNLIKTASPLEIGNGTITVKSDGGVIDVSSSGRLVINSGRIENKGRQVIYNEGGQVLIGGTVELVSKASGQYSNINRSTVQNVSGSTIITGGTIINTDGPAISVGTGTVTIGTKDGVSLSSFPIIIGKTYGVDSQSTEFSFYDGIIKGLTDAVRNESTTLPDSNIEVGYTKDYSTELINSLTYKVLTLIQNFVPQNITVHLQTNGGELPANTSSTIELTSGENISVLPEPTKGVYEFGGWYIDEELNTPVALPVTPQDGDTYYAKWSYPNNGELTTFRTTNDAMKTYYSSIDTWKLDESNFPEWGTGESTAMRVNFDSNNCMCADNQCSTSGNVHCDKPLGYDTRLGEKVNVYLYDEVNNEKGDLVLYSKSDDGVIYNLIPNKVYYWELDSDHSTYGYIKFISERRTIDAGDVLNIRDLGGLPVDLDNNGSTDGYLKYERLFRGSKLNSLNSITELTNLGITNELDLRKQSEAQDDYNNGYKLNNYLRKETQNYYVIPNSTDQTENDYYSITRDAVKYVMEQIAYHDDVNIYFHCRIGTDRTGTLAYILEGLLGVPDEDKVQDYELSFFYGLVNVHRYHNYKPSSSPEALRTHRFVYFHDALSTNQKVYEWYMAGSTEETRAYDEQLVQDFRDKMINYN